MKLKEFTYRYILPPITWGAINALSVSLRIHFQGMNQIENLKSEGKRIVYVFWHGRQFLFARTMVNHNIGIMVSTSLDGLLIANTLKIFGYKIIHGSSHRSPVRALIRSVQTMDRGFDVAFTVDGPRGPAYKMKPGALFLAKKMNAVILPATSSAYPSITFKSWDEYRLPKPFSHAAIVIGKPFVPSPDAGEDTLREECRKIENALNEITKKADEFVMKYAPH